MENKIKKRQKPLSTLKKGNIINNIITLVVTLILLSQVNIPVAGAQNNIIKGLRMPQLTTAQRDLISTYGNAAKGQRIYNLDTNCEEYWNGEEWVNLCVGASAPEVEFPANACSKLRIYGQYYAHVPLGSSHYVTFPVKVTKKGTYSIIASSGNGYYFQANGVFETLTGNNEFFEIKLEGIGTPTNSSIDQLTFTCNGTAIALPASCAAKVTVKSSAMSYDTDCDGIEIIGTYQTRVFCTGDNYIKVPIDIIEAGSAPNNKISFETDMVNGVKFSIADYELAPNSAGPDTLILNANGKPLQGGTYKFTFITNSAVKTTCTFMLNCISTLGTYEDPACKCLDIYNEYPGAQNGEYWLKDCQNGDKMVKTFCDIMGGGWTLVWSYSEKTAREIYIQSSTSPTSTGNRNTMEVSGEYYGVSRDREINVLRNGETTPIDYANFRLSRTEWEHFPIDHSNSQLKVHITENPKNVNDHWALNNYAIISPKGSISRNPIYTTGSPMSPAPEVIGKLFGQVWGVKANNGSGQGYNAWGNRGNYHLYSNNSYCTHWSLNRNGGNQPFTVIPNKGGSVNNHNFNNIDNVFGWFGGTSQSNHHFGKCGTGTTADDNYSFSTTDCNPANMYPHNLINNGEGRIIQWFVK